MSRSKKKNGFTLVETMIAIVIAVLVIGVPIGVIASGGNGLQRQSAAIRATSDLDILTTELKNSAHTAISVYTPASCGGTGAGDGTPCSQVRFYGKDSTGAAHFWGWNFSNGNVQECMSYLNAEDVNCAINGQTVAVTNFTATPTQLGNLASAKQIDPNASTDFATTEYNVLGTTVDPAQRVVAGNRIVVLDMNNAYVQREVHLLQGGVPFNTNVLHGAFESPTIGTLGLIAQNLTETMGAGSQTTTATETNYASYQQYISAPYWSVSSCLSSSGQLIANIVATGTGTGNFDTFQVTPMAPGTCTYTVTTYDQTATGTVQVIAAPTPTPTPTIAPTATPMPTPTGGPTAAPTATPTAAPTAKPTAQPTPTQQPPPMVTPTPVAACVGSGTLNFYMPATGGTCTLTGNVTMTASATVVTGRAGTTETANQSGTDTAFGDFTLYEQENTATGKSSDAYSGWYCYTGTVYAAAAGCSNIAVHFVTMPSASEPVSVKYTFSDFKETGSCADPGATMTFHTAQSQRELEAYSDNPSTPLPNTYASYETELLDRGYETTYTGIDPTSKEFYISQIAETDIAAGQRCTLNESYTYTITVVQKTGIVGGLSSSVPDGMTIYKGE